MYSEEIKYLSFYSDDNTHANKIRNAYFKNRNCMTNVLDFLDQEVVIMPGNYFSYDKGLYDIIVFDRIYSDQESDMDKYDLVCDYLTEINCYNGYHLSILNNYITIVANNRRCIFTNKDMEEGSIIGTILWVKNYNKLLKKFKDRNLKRISKALVHPIITKFYNCGDFNECIDDEFTLSMDIYYPDIVFKYSIDTYMSNFCIDVYNKLARHGLNGLVDKYIPSYKQCDLYEDTSNEGRYFYDLCRCGRLSDFCSLEF